MKNNKKSGKRGQNEGSIYQGKDGRWRAMVPAKYSPNGKRHMIVGSDRAGTNQREIIARRLAQALAGKSGSVVAPSRDTVAGFLSRWLSSVALRVRPKTLEGYSYTVDRLIVPAIGSMKLQALEPRHVVAMMARVKSEKYAPRTVAYARSVLRIALTDAKREGIVTRNVADREYVDPPRVPKGEVDVHDAAAVQKILTKIDDPGDRLLIATIASFGLRIGEALGLQWSDIEFDTKRLRIVRAVQRQPKKGLGFVEVKTSRSRRALRMSDNLVAQFKEHRRAQLEQKMKAGEFWHDEDLVFPTQIGTKMDARNALRILHRAERKAKVSRKGLHKLRNSAATILLTRGVPLDVVSDILGHSSIRVTVDTYRQFIVARQDQAADVMNELVSKESV